MSQETALVEWLSRTINEDLSPPDLCNPKYLHKLSKQLPDLNSIDFNDLEDIQDWQRNYVNLKSMYEAVQQYYSNVLKRPFPTGLPAINLLEMSKQQETEGFVTLLTIFFIACIQSASREKFITSILSLDELSQGELMRLVQQKTAEPAAVDEEELKQYMEEESKKGEMDQLYFRIQSLESENDSLNAEIQSMAEEVQKLKSANKKLEEEGRKIRRELDEKILYIDQKQQQEEEEESTNKIMSDSNEEIIKELKKQLVEQEKKKLEALSQIKEEMYLVKEQLGQARDRISELESEDLVTSASRKVHHRDCVSISQHKNMSNKMQLKLKAKEQKEIELEREIIRLKHEIEEQGRRIKKEEREKENMMEERRKAGQGQMVSAKTASQLRMYVLEKLRDNIKGRLEREGGEEVLMKGGISET